MLLVGSADISLLLNKWVDDRGSCAPGGYLGHFFFQVRKSVKVPASPKNGDGSTVETATAVEINQGGFWQLLE
jgi:hypothetical protein